MLKEEINITNMKSLQLFFIAHNIISLQNVFAGIRMKSFLCLIQNICLVLISGEEGEMENYWWLKRK